MTTNELCILNRGPEGARRYGKWTQTIDITLDVSSVVIKTLKDAAKISSVPFLSSAASITLSILGAVQQMRRNKHEFKELVKDSCKIVCDIIDENMGVSRPGDVPVGLEKNLEQLVNILRSIENFARKGASRNPIVAFFLSSLDAQRIQEYKEKLYQAIQIFGLQTDINLRKAVAELAANQVVIMKQLNNIARALELLQYNGLLHPSLPVRPRSLLGASQDDVSSVANSETSHEIAPIQIIVEKDKSNLDHDQPDKLQILIKEAIASNYSWQHCPFYTQGAVWADGINKEIEYLRPLESQQYIRRDDVVQIM